jgi:leucyl-tRNA synthetase
MQHIEAGPVVPLQAKTLTSSQVDMRREVHDTIAKVSDDISRRYTFNTAIAAIMELSNHLARFKDDSEQGRAVVQEAWLAIVRLLNPITPHICEVLWRELGMQGDLYAASWPQVDENARVRSQITLVVQINGKVRARLEAEPGLNQEDALKMALDLENVQRHIDSKTIRKVIHVPDRLLNIVVG